MYEETNKWAAYFTEQAKIEKAKRQEAAAKRKKTAEYRKSKPKAITDFELAIFLRTKKRVQYDDRTANGLTAFILDWLAFYGHYGARINIGGIMMPDGRWRTSGSTKGVADVIACIRGRFCQFEVKVGKDKPRADQLEQQRLTVAAGGCYLFVHNADEFVQYARRVEDGPSV